MAWMLQSITIFKGLVSYVYKHLVVVQACNMKLRKSQVMSPVCNMYGSFWYQNIQIIK